MPWVERPPATPSMRRHGQIGSQLHDSKYVPRTCHSVATATRRIYSGSAMAVVIASNLRKELAGSVLFDGVSFSVERRDRVALSGPNGAGKTTLLRSLAGETEKHGGELAFAKGTRAPLPAPRPTRGPGPSLREEGPTRASERVAALAWLARQLASLDAAVILVAHDRWFLEAVTAATLELGAGRATFFPGPWHAWRREKAARMLHAQKEAARVQADIARLERFVERFRAKKDKAKQAQAKLTQIGRLERERAAAAGEVALLSRRTRGLGFEFLKPARSGRTVVEAEGLEVAIGGRVL